MAYVYTDRLKAVREAIDKAIANDGITQFTTGDTSVTIGLEALREMERELERKIRLRRGACRNYVM